MTTVKYLCGVDFEHEMDQGLADFYDSTEELKKAKLCWKQCGIVKITLDSKGDLVSSEWIVEQKL